MLKKYFDKNNRLKTYKLSIISGFVLGPITFVILSTTNREIIHSKYFFINYIFLPLVIFFIISILSLLYRKLSRIYRLENNSNGISRGIVESTIRLLISTCSSYLILAIYFLIFEKLFR
jgi:hypothetical protein